MQRQDYYQDARQTPRLGAPRVVLGVPQQYYSPANRRPMTGVPRLSAGGENVSRDQSRFPRASSFGDDVARNYTDASRRRMQEGRSRADESNKINSNNMSQAQDLMSSQSATAAGNGIGGGTASPSFMGTGGAGFEGTNSIGGYSTGGIMGAGGATGVSTAGASSPAFGAAGAASMGGGAGAGGAGAGAGAGGAAMGAGGWVTAAIALVAGSKALQRQQGSNAVGRGIHGMIGPSVTQFGEDWKQGNYWGTIGALVGVPWINAFTSSDEAVEKDPEWQPVLDYMMGG